MMLIETDLLHSATMMVACGHHKKCIRSQSRSVSWRHLEVQLLKYLLLLANLRDRHTHLLLLVREAVLDHVERCECFQ